MELLAISGSIRSRSYNTALLKAIADCAEPPVKIKLFESLSALPVFNPEIDEPNFPDIINSLINDFNNSDAVIISAPEYAHGISGVLKNMLDWLVATDAVVLKPIVVTTVSTSGLGGVRSFSALVQILTAMNANVVIDGSLCVPYASRKFDAELNLKDQLTRDAIMILLKAIDRSVEQAKFQTS